ncbi:hypothetical protein [Photorhabdus laumondii]
MRSEMISRIFAIVFWLNLAKITSLSMRQAIANITMKYQTSEE